MTIEVRDGVAHAAIQLAVGITSTAAPDVMPTRVVVLDAAGTIQFVNKTWRASVRPTP